MEVQSGSRLVKDKQGWFLAFLTYKVSQFDTLVFSTG